ncbi:MAG: Txe/YoeB family addiction module toxin [Bacteroidaceae bacterium]|nr:Txe/YoeB family addiction module toxin [Bacteroidaceae bacterium]
MSYKIIVPQSVEKTLKKWKKSNPQLLKKFQKIYHELAEHPREGTGHPEPLRGGGNITYSRRISASHRLVYDIHDDTITVLILEVEGHYDDK